MYSFNPLHPYILRICGRRRRNFSHPCRATNPKSDTPSIYASRLSQTFFNPCRAESLPRLSRDSPAPASSRPAVPCSPDIALRYSESLSTSGPLSRQYRPRLHTQDAFPALPLFYWLSSSPLLPVLCLLTSSYSPTTRARRSLILSRSAFQPLIFDLDLFNLVYCFLACLIFACLLSYNVGQTVR